MWTCRSSSCYAVFMFILMLMLMMRMMMTLMKRVNSTTKFRHGIDKFYQPNSGLRGCKTWDEATYTYYVILYHFISFYIILNHIKSYYINIILSHTIYIYQYYEYIYIYQYQYYMYIHISYNSNTYYVIYNIKNNFI